MPFRNRYTPYARLICLCLALHFLNFSIDSKDRHPDSVPEDLTFNDIESVTEFFVEVVLNQVDTFHEHEEKDNDDGGSADTHKYFCSNNALVNIHCSLPISFSEKFQVKNLNMLLSPSASIIIPPPKS